jgi:hypothetical protein
LGDNDGGGSRLRGDLAPAELSLRARPATFHGVRVAVAVALAVLTVLLFPASPAVDFPIYEVGSVASDNVIAPFAFKVLKTDAELSAERESAARSVEPVYVFAPAALDSARRFLTGFMGSVAQAANASADSPSVAVQQAAGSWGIQLTTSQANYIANARRREALTQALGRVFDRWLSAGVATAGSLDSVRGSIVLRSKGEDRRV